MVETKPSAPIKPKPRFLKSPLIPFIIAVLAVGVGITGGLSQTGYITLPHINLPFGQSGVYKISPDATVGVPVSYEFSELISSFGPESGASPAIYTFYLGSGVGFPPMGLILGIDGVLKGTPTAKGTSKFQVCVKDVGGRSTCGTYSLTVNPKSEQNTTPITPIIGNCPAALNPPCGSAQNGVTAAGGIVPASCDCPSDSTYAGMDNVAPGGPYKICVCK